VLLACNNLDNAGTPAAVQSGNPVQRGVEEDAARLRRNFIKASNRVLFACWWALGVIQLMSPFFVKFRY
jgi:hypothetical protein